MPRASLAAYRKQWPRIGGVLAMAVGGATTLAAKKMTKPQLLSAVNFGAVLVHQYEEYVDPGWFPGQFNKGLFKSQSPRNAALTRQPRAEKLLALLGSLSTIRLSLAEQFRKLTVPVALGVLDVGVQAKRVAEALLGKPDEVVVLVPGAGDLPGLGAARHVPPFPSSIT